MGKFILSLLIASNLLFVGDSRFVGMRDTVDSDDMWFCKVGQGYSWFSKNIEDIESLVDDNTVIVFGLGVNDLYNISRYEGVEKYFDRMYYISVNPVDEYLEERYGYSIRNIDIEKFNARIQLMYKKRYIDCNSRLHLVGYSTVDGLHYTKSTYRTIYTYVRLRVYQEMCAEIVQETIWGMLSKGGN